MIYILLAPWFVGFVSATAYWHREMRRACREYRWPRFQYAQKYRDEMARWTAGVVAFALLIFATSA